MRYLLILVLASFSFQAYSQETDEPKAYDLDSASYIWLGQTRISPYVAGQLERTHLLEDQVTNLALSWGLLVNDRITFGTFLSVMTDDVSFPLIFPNGFNLEMVHGGIHTGYLWPISDAMSAGLDARLGFGEMEIDYDESAIDLFSTRFTSFNPSLMVDYQLWRYTKVTANFGYRFLSGYELNTDELADFDGMNMSIGVKIGLFKRLRWVNVIEDGNEE